jgi:RimJ/RimL family protein N-acetyltransferase
LDPIPVTLDGNHVRLEPLSLGHAEGLLEAGAEPLTWKYLTVPQPRTLDEMQSWICAALEMQAGGSQLPFAVIRKSDGKVMGTTRYLDIRSNDLGLEIGWTWYAPEAQRTAVNTECKYLLLAHAFETLGCIRVQLKTDALNERSRRAIERIGAKFEGVLRNYQRYWHGGLRDTAMYAMTDADWPEAKRALEEMLAR